MLSVEQMLSLRILWSYFVSGKESQFDKFCVWLRGFSLIHSERVPLLRDTIQILRAHFSAVCASSSPDLSLHSSAACAQFLSHITKDFQSTIPVVLIIDQMPYCEGQLAEQLQKQIELPKMDSPPVELLQRVSSFMDSDKAFYTVVTLMDPCFPTLVSHRHHPLKLELKLFSLLTVVQMFKSIRKIASDDRDGQSARRKELLNILLIEANGFPRHLEKVYDTLQNPNVFGQRQRLEFKSLFVRIQNQMPLSPPPAVGISAIALGFLGHAVDLNIVMPPPCSGTVSKLVQQGLYVFYGKRMASIGAPYVPLLAGFHVRSIVKERTSLLSERVPSALADDPIGSLKWTDSQNLFVSILSTIIDIFETQFEKKPGESRTKAFECGHIFENFHCCFELLHLLSYVICAPLLKLRLSSGHCVIETLSDHYRLEEAELPSNSWRIYCNRSSNYIAVQPSDQFRFLQEAGHLLLRTELIWTPSAFATDVKLRNLPGMLLEARDDPTKPSLLRMVGNQAGFDAVQLVRNAANPSELWCLLLELNFSYAEQETIGLGFGSNTGSVSGKCYQLFKHADLLKKIKEIGVKHIFLVVAAWRSLDSSFDSYRYPSYDGEFEILILSRPVLERFYCSLKPYAGLFSGDLNLIEKLFSEVIYIIIQI